MTRSEKKKRYDGMLIFVVLLLVAAGLVILYSTSAYNGQVKFHDPFHYLKKQGFATLLGLFGMALIARVDYHKWVPLAIPAYVTSIILSVAVQRMKRFRTMILMMIPVLPIVGLVGASNLSTAIIILGIAVVLIFVADPKYVRFILMGSIGVGFMTVFLAMESYRLERLAIWRHPEQYEKGYQTLQGLYAIGSGGLFGRGLGNSVQKLGFLPEAQNDMIFSIICEELGLIGAGFIILLFLILIWRFFVISTKASDLLGALIAAGAMAHMMIQVILNIAVVTNSIPNTGITLPFISYGGTSVVFLLLEMGLVLSVSNYEGLRYGGSE